MDNDREYDLLGSSKYIPIPNPNRVPVELGQIKTFRDILVYGYRAKLPVRQKDELSSLSLEEAVASA